MFLKDLDRDTKADRNSMCHTRGLQYNEEFSLGLFFLWTSFFAFLVIESFPELARRL